MKLLKKSMNKVENLKKYGESFGVSSVDERFITECRENRMAKLGI